MRGNSRSRRRVANDSLSAQAERLSEKAIKRQLRSDSLKHPATLIPFALSILFIIVFLVSPSLWALIFLIVSVIAAAGSFFWRYSIRYNKEYARRTQEIMELYQQEDSEREGSELKRLREDIQTGFSRVSSVEGLKALQELVHEYEQLQPVLERGKETAPMAVAHIPSLAEETYRQGLGVLAGTLELMREIHSPNNEKLKAETVRLDKEIESMTGDGTQAERLKMLEATLASHKGRLDLIEQQQLRVDGLLHQSDSCEASLHRVRIELAALKADSVDTRVDTVIDALQRTISQAKEVQEELKKLGY